MCIALVLLAGCGGGGSKDKTAADSSTSSTSGGGDTTLPGATTSKGAGGNTTVAKKTTPTVAPSASDAARVEKLVLLTEDFPAGWKGTQAPPSDDTSDEEINRCMGLSGKEAETAHKSGDDFSKGTGESAQASTEAATVKDDATYRKDLAAIQSAKLGECLEEAFKKEMASSSQAGVTPSFEQSELKVTKYGDSTVGRRLIITVKSSGGTSKFYIDIVFMGKNRAEVLVSFLDLDHPFDQNLEKSLLDKLGARINAA